MKLLDVIAEMGIGGAETVVASLVTDALAHGDAVTVASSGGWRADALAIQGARLMPVTLRGRRPRELLAAARALRRELQWESPDVVHVHNIKAALVMRLAGVARRRPPTAVTVHGVPDAQYGTSARMLRHCADEVVAVSTGVAERLAAAGYPPSRIRVIENAVRAGELPSREAARAALGLDPAVPVALCLARLAPPKRHDLLVSAWRAVPSDAVLLIAGDGPHRSAVETAVLSAGLADRIHVLGARDDVATLFAAADVSVLPSDSEGLPISVLEAMAAGVPVVVSAVGGLAEALPGAARLVEPGSTQALAAGITAVLTDPALRDALADSGRSLVSERFGLDRMLADYRALYADLLRQARSSSPFRSSRGT